MLANMYGATLVLYGQTIVYIVPNELLYWQRAWRVLYRVFGSIILHSLSYAANKYMTLTTQLSYSDFCNT